MRTVGIYGNAEIDRNIITWNGVILLWGPPGTGKTSLCKSLAQKLSIRLCNKYESFSLIEINAHSLFSKWFSESGKLIMKLFKHIRELCAYQESLIFVLIDEVESLASARKAAINGNEPSDSIRAVNALLTQIDQLKSFKNVLILSTSNISESIDLAFIDRADLKQFIGNPSDRARYHILSNCLNELLKKRILYLNTNKNKYDQQLFEYEKIKGLQYDLQSQISQIIPFPPSKPKNKDKSRNEMRECSQKLFDIIQDLNGFSGRALRKLPFMTSVNYIQSTTCSLNNYLDQLEKMAKFERKQRDKLKHTKSHRSELSEY